MNTILKIDEIFLPKLNNAEYTNLMGRTLVQIKTATEAKLGLTVADTDMLIANLDKMHDLVAKSRISDYTARLAELDAERDNLVVYLLTEIENKQRSPIAAVKEAATSLYNALHVYKGIQNLPAQQETQQISGLYLDTLKEENSPHVAMLGLTDIIATLVAINEEYARITDARTNAASDKQTANSKDVRAANDPVYDYIKTMAFVTSVSAPSAEATTFINHHNTLIKETNALYNLRTSKTAPATDPETDPGTDPDLPADLPSDLPAEA